MMLPWAGVGLTLIENRARSVSPDCSLSPLRNRGQRVYIHPRRDVFEPLYTLFKEWRKGRFGLENKRFSAIVRPDLKVAVFSYESLL